VPRVDVAEQPGVGLNGVPRPSEDVVIVLPNAVIVLDGATTLRTDLPSGGWYAAELAGALAGRLVGSPDVDLADLLAASIKALARQSGLTPGASPSSTVALLRWDEQRLEALVLGDSPVVAFGSNGPEVLADNRLADIPRGGGSYRKRLRDGGGYGSGHLDALRSSGEEMDLWRNRDGGFWVAEADPDAAYEARRARWPRAGLRAVLIATDGVSCGVDDYRIFPDWSAVLDLAVSRGAAAVLNMVRDAERSDPEGTRWPRPKPHDDQALVLLDFTSDRARSS
jgi:hypothetical protein